DALNTLLQSKANLTLVDANKFYYNLLKNVVDATFKDEYGIEKEDKVKIIDWQNPENNDFLITRQFKISGEMYNCRADMVLFVNGLPLVFIELKASHKHLENAYNDNIKHYLDAIPQAFYYNAFIVISNGTETKIGSITSPLEHFSDWKKINDEGEAGVISLDTVIKGVFDKNNLLDIIENFILYQKTTKGLIKIVGKNHQFLGVNRAFRKIDNEEVRKTKKLGVFWHTQGSGKIFSMVFLAQKVLRKIEGNWTFLIVTDRDDLDTQIYNNFVDTGAVTEDNVRASSKNNLKKLLSEDHRYVFTMIQKFQGAEKISDRNDIIVFTDEAHRSQYNKLAMDMRKALPNACFLAFTGTPLIRGDEKTKEVFGDYTSIYNFEQSILDKATVKLYYENRRPDLQIVNPNMEEEIQAIIDEAELTEEQEERFASKYANMYQAITRDDRLDKVAQDIVTHFMGRGYMGKAMYVAIDKPTAVRMCDKVQYFWKEHIKELEKELKSADDEQRKYLQNKIDYMKETDMTVVVSASQNEIEYCKKRGADITPYRLRINKEGIKNIENRFKDADDPLRIVFVCSMWITGFDAQCVSTMYLDKILKDHTLMQTIARANRVAKGKNNGIIVDYIGIFNAKNATAGNLVGFSENKAAITADGYVTWIFKSLNLTGGETYYLYFFESKDSYTTTTNRVALTAQGNTYSPAMCWKGTEYTNYAPLFKAAISDAGQPIVYQTHTNAAASKLYPGTFYYNYGTSSVTEDNANWDNLWVSNTCPVQVAVKCNQNYISGYNGYFQATTTEATYTIKALGQYKIKGIRLTGLAERDGGGDCTVTLTKPDATTATFSQSDGTTVMIDQTLGTAATSTTFKVQCDQSDGRVKNVELVVLVESDDNKISTISDLGVYNIKLVAGDYYISSSSKVTTTDASAANIQFISTGTANQYYLYDVDQKKFYKDVSPDTRTEAAALSLDYSIDNATTFNLREDKIPYQYIIE
ncbi:type I restriction endonuclease subunit R, partial [bacterium]|nr:type I restriction endonuclease subunit R [bacterium]